MRILSVIIILFLAVPLIKGQSRSDTTGNAVPDTTAPVVRTWQLKDDYSRLEDYPLDTMQTSFQIFNPVFMQSYCNLYLGNLGLAARTNLYFVPRTDIRYLFLIPYSPYLVKASDNVYFNVRKPFSLLEYSSTGQNKEKRGQMVRAFHTQNINQYLNGGFDLRMSASEGHFTNQRARFTNVRFFSSYIKGDLSFHGSFAYNSLKCNENGGIQSDSLFIETNQDEQTYPVNLADAQSYSQMRNLNFQVTSRYRFGKDSVYQDTTSATGFRRLRDRTSKTGSLIHTFEYEHNNRLYEDYTASISEGFYDNFFIDPDGSSDSTFQRSILNTFQIMLDENPSRKNDFGARAFISHELVKYVFNIPPDTNITTDYDTVINFFNKKTYNNIYAGASLVHTVGQGWNWIFTGKIWLTGYRAGDIILNGEIDKFINTRNGKTSISVGGSLTNLEPNYYLAHYASNHLIWENDFNKTKEIIAFIRLNNEPYKFNLKGSISAISDYIYIGNDANPSQYHPVLNVFSAELYKHFKLGPFNSINRMVYQIPTNSTIIRMPNFACYSSDFFAFSLAKKVLTVEVGFDLYYYTAYKGYAYIPSSGMFYHQDIKRIGNYPYFDAFLTAKLKRTRFFVKYDHFNAGLMGKNYFNVLHYPMPGATFRWGLSWIFYD
jgi:hypothetical protein